jgi:hypothetical protein
MVPKQRFSEPGLISLSHRDMNAPPPPPPLILTRDVGSSSSPSSTVFGWSDIPCQGDDPMQCSATTSLTEEYNYYHHCPSPSPSSQQPNVVPIRMRLPEVPLLWSQRRISISVPPVLPLPPLPQVHDAPSLPLSPRSTMQCDDLGSTTTTTATTRKTVSIVGANSGSITTVTKHVSFAPTVHVRTHTVTVGDHPCCTGGMALTCGWESIDSIVPLPELLVDAQQCPVEDAVMDQEQRWSCCWHESSSSSSSSSSTLPATSPPFATKRVVRRGATMMDWHLSYEARRQRLQEVTGWAERQLLWEEYRLVRGGGDAQDKVSSTTLLDSTLNVI